MDNFDFWTGAEGIENEIAPGHMSRRHTNRTSRKHEIAIAINTIGRNVAFGKGGSTTNASAPDPMIGQAAMKNAQIGEDWLKFANQQFEAGNIRQDDMDALTKRVTESNLASQDQATKWAQEDRNIQTGYREKYDKWADEDRQLGRDTKTKFDHMGDEANALGGRYQGYLESVAQDFGGKANEQFDFAKEQQGRYKSTFVPIEDRLASDAMTWDSADRLASEAGKAKADVTQNAAAQRAASERSMASMGVDPRSGRFAGVSRSTDLSTALAAAGAQNTARDVVRQQGIQLRGQAAQIGQQVNANANTATSLGMQARSAQQGATQAAYTTGSAGQAAQMQATTAGLAAAGVGNTSAGMALTNQGAGYTGINTGINAGQAAVGATQAANSNFYQNNNTMAQGFGGAMQGYSNSGNIMNNQYGTQTSAANAAAAANAQSSAGAMQGIGTVVGAGIMVF